MEDTPNSTDILADEVHLWDYMQVVLQRLPLALSVWAAVMVIAVVYTWTCTPRYTAASRLLIESSEVNLTDMKGPYTAGQDLGRREFMQTQVKLITSTPVLEAALDKADLLADPEFREARDPVRRLATYLAVTPVRNTYLVDISVEHENRRLAAQIVNAVVDSFLSQNRQRRLGISEEGLQELHKKAETLREKLNTATAELQSFMVTNSIVSFDEAKSVVLKTLGALNDQLTKIQPQRMALQARVDAAREALAKGQQADSLPDVIRSEVVRALRLDLMRLEGEYSQMLERLGSNHAQLQAVSTQIQALRTRLALEADAILTSLETEYLQATKEEELLRERLRLQEAEVFRFNKLASQYDVLKQNKDSIESTYQTIIRRIQEIDSNRMGAQGENIFVISRATPPVQKSWPSRARHLFVAVVLGLCSAVGLCFFLDYMDITIKGESDVKHLLRTHVLAGIPDTGLQNAADGSSDLIVSEQPRSHAAEAFRSLRTVLALNMPGEPLRSVVVSSTLPAEGKSLMAINLAITEANVGRKTLLIDADMRKPRLHSVFAVSAKRGLSNLLAEDKGLKLDDVIIPTSVKNLYLLPCGPLPPNPVEIVDSARFGKLIRDIGAQFDFAVLDSPPGLSLADSLVMARQTDGLLLVVRSFLTAKAAAQHFAENVRASNVRLLGVVLNNVDVPKGGYYYGAYYNRYYHYYYAYRYGYGQDGASARSPWRGALTAVREQFAQTFARFRKSESRG